MYKYFYPHINNNNINLFYDAILIFVGIYIIGELIFMNTNIFVQNVFRCCFLYLIPNLFHNYYTIINRPYKRIIVKDIENISKTDDFINTRYEKYIYNQYKKIEVSQKYIYMWIDF